MRKILIYSGLVLLVFSNISLWSQITPVIDLDRDSILIGEQIKMKISVSYDVSKPHDINWPKIEGKIGDKAEAVFSSRIDTLAGDKSNVNIFVQSREILLTSFDSGLVAIPPFNFKINKRNVATDAFLIHVAIPKVDMLNDFIDIGNVIEVEISWIDYLKGYKNWILSIVGLILFLIIGRKLLKKYRENKLKDPEVEEIVIIPHELAFENLELLKKQKLHQQGLVKEYYIKLTDIIREYIEKRYDIQATDETTDEIIAELRRINVHKKDRSTLSKILSLADLVKFAKAKPSVFDHEESMNRAYQFVENTKEIGREADHE